MGEDLRPINLKPAGRWTRQLPLYLRASYLLCRSVLLGLRVAPARFAVPCRVAFRPTRLSGLA